MAKLNLRAVARDIASRMVRVSYSCSADAARIMANWVCGNLAERAAHDKAIALKRWKPKTARMVLEEKVNRFKSRNGIQVRVPYGCDEVMAKFGNNPACAFTGDPIDYSDPRSYQLDHITPSANGGSNELENMQICLSVVNCAKRDMTDGQFVSLCQKVAKFRCKDNSTIYELSNPRPDTV